MIISKSKRIFFLRFRYMNCHMNYKKYFHHRYCKFDKENYCDFSGENNRTGDFTQMQEAGTYYNISYSVINLLCLW